MKMIKVLAFSLAVLGLGATVAGAAAPSGLYGLSATGLDGKPVALSAYAGKVVLVVNTASRCGFTPQYEALQKLQKKYEGRGFAVLGFPSNDFGGQEPGTNSEIKKFCTLKYDVTFPVFGKDKVVGSAKQPVYRFLTEQSPEKLRGEVDWNFEKFLVNRRGEVVGRFKSRVKPEDGELVHALEAAL